MKKTLIVLVAVVLAMVACDKDEQNEITTPVLKVDTTTKKILAFKAKLDTEARGNESYIVDSAVWYLEGALNYTYCMHTEEDPIVTKQENKSFSFPVETSDAQISVEALNTIYSNAETQVLKDFTAFTAPVKDLLVIDVDFRNDTLFFTSLIGFSDDECRACSHSDVITTAPSFTDNWLYKGEYDAGTCPERECKEWALDKLLTMKFNAQLKHVLHPGEYYYTDVKPVGTRGLPYSKYAPLTFPNPNSNDPNFCYQYLFWEGGDFDVNNTYSWCVTMEECNFYIKSLPKVDSLIRVYNAENHPDYINDEYDLMRVYIFGDMLVSQVPYPFIMHRASFWYGKLHYGSPIH